MVAVITADLINSSLYDEDLMKQVLISLNNEFELIKERFGKNKVRFSIYRGDSFQGIINNPENALLIAMQIKTAVNCLVLKKTGKKSAQAIVADFKFAIGMGTVEMERKEIAESNGQAFQFSGRTLDEIKKENRKTGIKTPFEDINNEFNTSFFLLDTITDKWSTASAEVVYYLLKDLREKEIAAKLTISQSAVNQRKKAAGWEAVSHLLTRYREAIKKYV